MTAIEVDSLGEVVLLAVPRVDNDIVQLTTRQAFDLVTDLLTHIDAARSFGAARRGEIPDPDPRAQEHAKADRKKRQAAEASKRYRDKKAREKKEAQG